MKKFIATILTAFLATAGFAQTVDDHAKAKKCAVVGGVAGAIAGAIIGNNRGHHSSKRGAVVGTVVGGAAGAIVGAMMDKQERELRQIEGVNVTRTHAVPSMRRCNAVARASICIRSRSRSTFIVRSHPRSTSSTSSTSRGIQRATPWTR
jgi:phage tail tape-measure protein